MLKHNPLTLLFSYTLLGLDAFLLHGSELHLYNKINIENVDINTRTVAVFRALPTCVAQKSCGDCFHLRDASSFACTWCPTSGHCSDGADRLRQTWDDNECQVSNTTSCTEGHTEWRHSSDGSGSEKSTSSSSVVVSAVVSSLMVIILIFILIAFLYLYGKYNENSVIGRQLIVLRSSYNQFGASKGTTLELGKKKSEQNPAREFVNPHHMLTNNNVITAAM